MISFIDLFSGCGGLSEGFMQSGGYKACAHVEWRKPMVDTLRERLIQKWDYEPLEAKKRVVHYDVMDGKRLVNGRLDDVHFDNHEESIVGGLIGLVDDKVDLVIGGPPCQAYSMAGRAQDPNSMKNDYRNYLFENFCFVVENFKPKVFVFENVPGILSASPGGLSVTKRIYEAFDSIGYEILRPNELKSKAVLNSADYGVPQNRRRVIIVGIRKDLNLDIYDVYKLLEKEKTRNKITIREAFSTISEEFKKVDPHSVPRNHNDRDKKLFFDWVNQNMNASSTQEKLNFYHSRTGKASNHVKYRNLEWESQSPTVVAHLKKDGLMFIHPNKDLMRSITVREAAVLQSFPLDYEFKGGMGTNYEMIGNAVPVEMAKRIANALKNIFE
jgi:DNA (cytosine-5)-methyltransferase 1